MQPKYIIIAAAVIAVVVIGIAIGAGMRLPSAGGNIGVVEITDIIYTPKRVVKELYDFGDDPSIRAIILRINSPGGVVAASQEIYDAVKCQQGKKPVIASMESVAASGAYYIALPSDIIVANPGTVTGSIGVIMEWPVLEKLLDKLGIEFETIKSREHKDIGSTHRRMTDKERQLMQGMVTDVYEQFVEVTSEHRSMPLDSVLKYADGRVFSGRQAKEIGLVDTLGSFETAVEIAGDLLGIEKPNLVFAPKRLSFVDLLLKPLERISLPKLYFVWR
ncbi:signal peptide peptidase SppA [candidate division WOR-3 bacterium]|nr:signal peptide peptidase SppA [candidate division WOR-3 bacterium]